MQLAAVELNQPINGTVVDELCRPVYYLFNNKHRTNIDL
jgi:hypothetical protein